uniref:Transcription factor HNF-4 homolog n=1 Tax=Rhabditophanes sp. KR3021 TaxID=114890 RepID=A0AC35U0D6_9BILA
MSETKKIKEENRSPSESQPEELCVVCNDISTGWHYSVSSCKTFFRRTIMKKQTFTCQYDGNCLIDKSVRCACRHCRFKKCLDRGMDRNSIQQNRDPIGYTKRTRRYPRIEATDKKVSANEFAGPESIKQLTSPSLIYNQPPSATLSHSSSHNSISTKGSLNNSTNNLSHNPSDCRCSSYHQYEQTLEVQAEDHLFNNLVELETNMDNLRCSHMACNKNLCELIASPSMFTNKEFMEKQTKNFHSYTNLRPALSADFQYWHERDWIIMIEFAKSIPAYANLPCTCQLALLRHSAITFPTLQQCYYSPAKETEKIIFPNGAFFNNNSVPNNDRSAGYHRKKMQLLEQLLKPMRQLKINANEYAAIRAIFFLNPDVDDMNEASRNKVSEERNRITGALYRYLLRNYDLIEGPKRYSSLLLLGTIIATIGVEMREAVVVADFFGQIQFSAFAKQLLFGNKDGDYSHDHGTEICPLNSTRSTFLNSSGISSSNSMNSYPSPPTIINHHSPQNFRQQLPIHPNIHPQIPTSMPMQPYHQFQASNQNIQILIGNHNQQMRLNEAANMYADFISMSNGQHN